MNFFKLPNNILCKIYEYDNTYLDYYNKLLSILLVKSNQKKFKRYILLYLYKKIITKEFHILYYNVNIIIKYIKSSLIKIYSYDKIYELLNFYKNKRILLSFEINQKSKIILDIKHHNNINNIIFYMLDLHKINELILDIYNNYKDEYNNNKYLYYKCNNSYIYKNY